MPVDALFDTLLRITDNPEVAFILLGYFAGVATKNGLNIATRMINRLFGLVPGATTSGDDGNGGDAKGQ